MAPCPQSAHNIKKGMPPIFFSIYKAYCAAGRVLKLPNYSPNIKQLLSKSHSTPADHL